MRDRQIGIKNKLSEGLTFKISRFKEVIKRTVPHKHDEYYELIFLSEGEGFHCIESEKYIISSPEVYFLKPGQLHFWQFTSIPKGFVILFKVSEFDAIRENDLWEMLRSFSDIVRIGLKPAGFPQFILNEILVEFMLGAEYSREIIHGLLKALLGKLLQAAEAGAGKPGVPPSVFGKFQALLEKEGGRLHRVNEYAGLLNVTPQHLNVICRKEAGKSASEMIVAQVVLEAKRYILHTDHTINEIADMLAFSDTSNFVKFFKKMQGVTPVRFRNVFFQ